MNKVVFLDTSVLCNVLRVPGKCQNHETVVAELRTRIDEEETLVLPTATIIETGNHIAQLLDGAVRRERAERLADFLAATRRRAGAVEAARGVVERRLPPRRVRRRSRLSAAPRDGDAEGRNR